MSNESLKLTPLLCVVFKFFDSLIILFLFTVLSAKRVSLAQRYDARSFTRQIVI